MLAITTTCVISELCSSGKTVTFSPDMSPANGKPTPGERPTGYRLRPTDRDRIHHGELKTHRSSVRRGFTRVFGTIKDAMLFAFSFAGTNVMILRTWHAVRRIPDPWAVALGETDLGDGAGIDTRTTRAARRIHKYADIGVAPPPDNPSADSGGTYIEVTACHRTHGPNPGR